MIDMTDNNTLEIRNKKYGLQLAKMGFDLIDLIPCRDGIHCIFTYSEEALIAFKKLIAENKKRRYMLSDMDARILIGYLEGYEINDNDRIRLLSVFDKVLNKSDFELDSLDEVSEESFIDNEVESVTDMDVIQLKQAMSGVKDYSKYDAAYDNAVKN